MKDVCRKIHNSDSEVVYSHLNSPVNVRASTSDWISIKIVEQEYLSGRKWGNSLITSKVLPEKCLISNNQFSWHHFIGFILT